MSSFAYDKYTSILPNQKAVLEFNGTPVGCDGTMRSATVKAEAMMHNIYHGYANPGTIEIWRVDSSNNKIGRSPARRIWCGGRASLTG